MRLTIHVRREPDEVVVHVERDGRFYDEVVFHVSEVDEFYAYMHGVLKQVFK